MPRILRSSRSNARPASLVTIPPCNSSGALSQIEGLLESIVDAISNGVTLKIPYRDARSSSVRSRARAEVVRFPGRSIQEAKKFECLFRIIELSHEALLNGTLITKRNLYYQNTDLFRSQDVVDDMVDNLAFTLGVGRADLNIVAAAKGLISGPIDLITRDGETVRCGLAGDGVLLPTIQSIEKVDFHGAKWLLVVEKEASFRTLALRKYWNHSRAGPGVLVTAKGFPDLATRKFLHILQSIRPELVFLGLVDYDPHGISILRTYKYGSKRLGHEENVTIPGMKWLGIRSGDLFVHNSPLIGQEAQDEVALQFQGSRYGVRDAARPSKRRRLAQTANYPEPISTSVLTRADRKKAVNVIKDIGSMDNLDADSREHLGELQTMLMLNVKAEIQAVDNFGDMTEWLDDRLPRCV